ncbi:MAG TPA: molybdopterin-dependent oxidoreductase [Acidimicrobiales bacterium]|nr:molybdopterin-dependent oxidoreductase [Acidimicrobiales bacterium]
MTLSRRAFLGGSAAAAGGLVLADHLRFFQPASAQDSGPEPSPAVGVITGKELVYRTGHSNNCDGACGHLVHVVDGRVTMVGPAPWGTKTVSGAPAPTFHPRICARGLSQISNTYSPDRIKYPYKRVGPRGSGKWQRISWDEATTMIAENFTRIQAKYGKTSVWVAPYTGSLGLIEGVVGVGFRFASVIGASAGDSEGDNEGDSATPCGWNYVLVDPTNPANGGGFFTGHESVDFLSAKAIVFWANNVAETSIPDWRIMLDARDQSGTQLISIDPRFTVTAAASDQWLAIRPGADTALIDGVINYVLTNGLYDAAYVRAYTVGPYLVDPRTKGWLRAKDAIPGTKGKAGEGYVVFDESDRKVKAASDPTLKAPALLGSYTAGPVQAPTALQALADAMSEFTPERTSELTDIPVEQVISLAQTWGTSKPLAVRVGFGLSHWYHGDLHMQALVTLQAITGNIGVHGGGITTFAGGLTTTAFDLAHFWAPTGKPYTLLEPMNFCDAVEQDRPFPVRAAWFMIDNFAQQMSDRNRVVEAMKDLEFCVVSDYVLSATADLADVVLPACTYFEKTDLLSSNNFYLQYMPKIIDPLFESKSDLDAAYLVADKMGFGQYFDRSPDEYLREILHMGQDDADPTVKGLTWEQLTTDCVHLNTDPLPYVPFFNKQFPTKSGKIEFYVEMLVPYGQEIAVHQEPIEASPTNPLYKKYPLVFLSTHTRFRTHSQYVDLPWLKEVNNGGNGFLEINPRDAAHRHIDDGDIVRIFNDRGQMKVRARLTESMKPGVVNCYQGGWDTIKVKHYIEGHPNNLTHQIAKPAQVLIPNFPSNAAYYDCLVQVERAEV